MDFVKVIDSVCVAPWMRRRSDIRMLVEVSAEQQLALDWVLLTDYLALFGLTDRVEAMKVWYGEINGE